MTADIFWPMLFAALVANAITVLIIYVAVSYNRGTGSIVHIGGRVVGAGATVVAAIVRWYLLLVFLGGTAYVIKRLVAG